MGEHTYNYLQELSRSNFQIVNGEPDIIGWEVKNETGVYIGEVYELLFEPQTKAVRYLVINLEDNGMNLGAKKVMIPLGIAHLHTSDDEVVLPGLHIDQYNALPDYNKDEIRPEMEVHIRNIIGSPAALRMEDAISEFDQHAFYAHHHFDKGRFYQRGGALRRIIVCAFLTMDGVIQAPGSPDEDRRNNFKWGGWSFPHWDEVMTNYMAKITRSPYDLLLGRRTYEIFAAFWPHQENNPTTETFNRIQKIVVGGTDTDISWKNSSLISADVVQELKKLKGQTGPDLLVYGSGKLCQTLFQHQLVDVLHTLTFPVTLGSGERLFQEGTQPMQWKLSDSAVSGTGVFLASYLPDGNVKTGTM
ncbi:dihydrofolate reductase [Pedobacter africanus]|uniref:Dihydrofolate reductase n=1 Tax=Pedobacter africanus TaxID=151894 RepID=A0ACC6KRR1_9SPHI|nr:dihydrofolate reductase family protein [Pedobacter africanus]MDR6781886.1 dihydrofolate reductase [Pedobacter africanus]